MIPLHPIYAPRLCPRPSPSNLSWLWPEMTTPKCRERFVYQEVYASLKRHHSQIQYHMSYMYIVVTYIYTMQILVSFIHRCLEMRLILGEMLHVLKTVAENNNRWCQLVHWTVMNRCWSILFMFSSHLYINLLLVWNKTHKPTLKGQGWFLRKTWLTKKTTIFSSQIQLNI